MASAQSLPSKVQPGGSHLPWHLPQPWVPPLLNITCSFCAAPFQTCHLQNLKQTFLEARIPKSGLPWTNKMLKKKKKPKKKKALGFGFWKTYISGLRVCVTFLRSIGCDRQCFSGCGMQCCDSEMVWNNVICPAGWCKVMGVSIIGPYWGLALRQGTGEKLLGYFWESSLHCFL